MTKITNRILAKDSDSYQNRQGKRRLTTLNEVKQDLNLNLGIFFNCFKKSVEMYNRGYAIVPPDKQIRNYSAVAFNQCLVLSAFESFAKKCFFGKYKRFYISLDGYTIQPKKLNSKGYPMNVKTGNVNDISSQLALDLFGDSQAYNPILFFGYKTDKLGNFVEPQIVYIDEGAIKFVITEENIGNFNFQEIGNNIDNNNEVRLRVKVGLKEAK